jgi:hypothetical protein
MIRDLIAILGVCLGAYGSYALGPAGAAISIGNLLMIVAVGLALRQTDDAEEEQPREDEEA